MERYTDLLSDRSTVIALAALGVGLTAIVPRLFFGNSELEKLPLNGKELGSYYKRLMTFVHHADKLYVQGYNKFRNTAWRITSVDGERVVVPNQYLDELRHMPDDIFSNTIALDMSVESKYTGLKSDQPFLNHLVRADLTRNLPRVNNRLYLEVEKASKTELPPCDDWTSVNVNQALLRIVAIVSGHIFLGPELCRREEYLHASINYTVDVFAAVRALKQWPEFLRPIGVFFARKELRGIVKHKEGAKRFLEPIILERRKMMAEKEKNGGAGEELPDDMLQWMLNKADSHGVGEVDDLAVLMLQLSMAAIHTTSMTSTHALYDLVSRPELIKDLREEIESVLKESDGVFTTQALFQMKLLDSFLHESQRLNPLSMARFARYVRKPMTLHDGLKIPAGVVVEAPMVAIHTDPSFYPEPEKFDPYRFYRLRNGEVKDPIGYKSPEQYQFVAVTQENMGFGYGRHACPGRFFAANEIKLIMARLILDFDMKMPEGETKRYDNLVMATSVLPDPKKEIMLKRRVRA